MGYPCSSVFIRGFLKVPSCRAFRRLRKNAARASKKPTPISTSLTVSAAFSSLPTTLLFHEQLIGVTPSPALPWFNRADDGMAGRAKVFRAPFHFLKFRMSPFFSRYFLAQRESAL